MSAGTSTLDVRRDRDHAARGTGRESPGRCRARRAWAALRPHEPLDAAHHRSVALRAGKRGSLGMHSRASSSPDASNRPSLTDVPPTSIRCSTAEPRACQPPSPGARRVPADSHSDHHTPAARCRERPFAAKAHILPPSASGRTRTSGRRKSTAGNTAPELTPPTEARRRTERATTPGGGAGSGGAARRASALTRRRPRRGANPMWPDADGHADERGNDPVHAHVGERQRVEGKRRPRRTRRAARWRCSRRS